MSAPLKNPENYNNGRAVAKYLRQVIDQIESGHEWVNFNLNIWWAPEHRVRESYIKKFGEVEGVKLFDKASLLAEPQNV